MDPRIERFAWRMRRLPGSEYRYVDDNDPGIYPGIPQPLRRTDVLPEPEEGFPTELEELARVNHPPTMETTEFRNWWWYIHHEDGLIGPVRFCDMLERFHQGEFRISMMVRRSCDERFVSLADMFILYGRNPFIPYQMTAAYVPAPEILRDNPDYGTGFAEQAAAGLVEGDGGGVIPEDHEVFFIGGFRVIRPVQEEQVIRVEQPAPPEFVGGGDADGVVIPGEEEEGNDEMDVDDEEEPTLANYSEDEDGI